jgi:hypothetical protein
MQAQRKETKTYLQQKNKSGYSLRVASKQSIYSVSAKRSAACQNHILA